VKTSEKLIHITAGRCSTLQAPDIESAKEDPAMTYMTRIVSQNAPAASPLMLSDRLLTLAEDADKAGHRTAAESLLFLASKVLDRRARPRH
jgi:hypothetical protein